MAVPYAEVIGDPITHSKSPLIHKFWLEKLGLEGDYRAVQVGPASLDAGADTRGGAGQGQPTEDHADQPHHHGHEGPGSPAGDANRGDRDVCGRRSGKVGCQGNEDT